MQVGSYVPAIELLIFCLLKYNLVLLWQSVFPYLWWWSVVSAFGSSATSTRHEWWYFLFQYSNYNNRKITVQLTSKCLKCKFVLCRLQRYTYQRNFANRGCSDESWIGILRCWNFHWHRKIYQAEQYNAKGWCFSVSKSILKIWMERP